MEFGPDNILPALANEYERGCLPDQSESLRTCFKSLSSMCFASIATQATLAESDARARVVIMLSVIGRWDQPDLLALAYGIEATTALLTVSNQALMQRYMIQCLGDSTCAMCMSCISLARRHMSTGTRFPPIGSKAGEGNTEQELHKHAQQLLESSLKLLENLLLCVPVRDDLVRMHDCCALLVGCLQEVAPLSAPLSERCLCALANLISSSTGGIIPTDEAGASPLQKVVSAGVCEAVEVVLLTFGCDDVCCADSALFLLQSLAAQSEEALSHFGRITHSLGPPARVMLHPVPAVCDLGATGTVALLLRVLAAHCQGSITVTEAAVGALGALVVQDNAMMLHLLANRGLPTLMVVLDTWARSSAGISAKCLRILLCAVEMLRRCRNEVARVDAYYSGGGGGASGVQQTKPFGRAAAEEYDSRHGAASVFGDDDSDNEDAEPVREVDVGVLGATPAFVYTVLDRVDIEVVLMDAESGALERELSKHEGAAVKRKLSMGMAGGLAAMVMKVKSFKGGASSKSSIESTKHSTSESSPATEPAPPQAATADGAVQSQSAPSLPKLLLAGARAAGQSHPVMSVGQAGPSNAHSSSLANLKKALDRATASKHHLLPFDPTPPVLDQHHAIPAAATPLFERALHLVDMHGAAHLEVLHPAVRLLLTLCDGSTFPYHWVQISNKGGCAVLIRALSNRDLRASPGGDGGPGPAGADPVYACEIALQALLHLALCNFETRDKLRQLHAHTVVVDFLHCHGAASLLLCELAAQLFVHLYADVSAKEANEGNPQACRSLVQLLLQYGSQSALFAEAGTCALKTLALFPPNRRLLGEKSGCATVVGIIRQHTLDAAGLRSAKVALFGLATISHLAGLEDNQSRLAKCGACRLVVDLLSAYGHSSEVVAAEGLSAISALAVANRAMLGEVGACEAAVALLRHYAGGAQGLNDAIVLVAAVAIYNLCTQYPENKRRLAALQVAVDLRSLLGIRQLSYGAREAVKDAVNIVSF